MAKQKDTAVSLMLHTALPFDSNLFSDERFA